MIENIVALKIARICDQEVRSQVIMKKKEKHLIDLLPHSQSKATLKANQVVNSRNSF